MTDPEKESENQKGLSKEAWAAVSAIAVALMGSIITSVTTLMVGRVTSYQKYSVI